MKALAYCKTEYKRRRQAESCHESHTACDVMRDCETLFPDLGTFGCEGFCDECGRYVVSYLNTGDPYGLTILFETLPRSVRWSVGSWGDIVETPAGMRRFSS